MKLVPLQRASLVVISIDAVVIAFGFVTGSALLPRAANLVLTVISLVLLASTVVLARGGYNFENPTLPAWSVVVAVIAFFGGAFLFAFPVMTGNSAGSVEHENGKYQEVDDGVVVRELTEEQYDAALVGHQREAAGLGLAFAGLTFTYAGVRHRK
jgi:hypothetical protein